MDRWLYHPWLAGVAVLAAAWLGWYLHLRSETARIVTLAVLAVVTLAWPFVGVGLWMIETVDEDILWISASANEHNDVQAHLTSAIGRVTHSVTLGADRGWGSRSHTLVHVGYVGSGDSGPPPLDLEFTAADELAVTYEGRVVYLVTFDPRTLDVLSEECRPVREGSHVIGCEG